jgi:hypothetical protein
MQLTFNLIPPFPRSGALRIAGRLQPPGEASKSPFVA